ncbi:MAG: heme-copper oxidase subunit III, partial [Sphingobacteriaceae bacterium]
MENIAYTDQPATQESKRIHPHKFTLWLALGSIVMMFAGMTSAYIVKRNQVNWQGFELPVIFWYSTATIVASSFAIQFAVKAFKDRQMGRYRQLIGLTAVLGVAFIAMQWIGFTNLNDRGIKLIGQGSNVSGSFLFAITALHMAHVLGGIIAIFIMLGQAFRRSRRSYSVVPVDNMATYWHFVDALWI